MKFKVGDKVYYKDDVDRNVFVVYAIYPNKMVSLGLKDYPDTEQDNQISIDKIEKMKTEFNINKEHKGLIEKTNKAHLKHLGLKIDKDGMIYKGDICLFCLPLEWGENDLNLFLEGFSSCFDNQYKMEV